MFHKVLVANRGEIAVRVIRALQEMGVRSVAVFSDVDRAALHVRMADEAVGIGAAVSSESYLRIDRILEAARKTRAEAIHPGYGFLSESAEFAAACESAGFVFIGPPPSAIQAMGWKTEARRAAIRAGVAVVPGSEEPVATLEHAKRVAGGLGYPVMLKAAAGGGGKGMRRVESEADLESAFRDASSEAERAFNSRAVYLEKLIERPRHIEIQLLGDRHGHMVHLGERECSLQRRHQKVVEECPSPFIERRPELRDNMGEASVRIASSVGYWNAGTAEFLVDETGNFYFLEMNTRLQVEHPVTEWVTGMDLVHWQLRIAAGERLTIRQEDVRWRGAAIECRVCAEDPSHNFLPSPGRIEGLREPSGPGIRVDSGIYAGWTVPMEYDSLLAKVAVWGPDRSVAIERMLRAVGEYSIRGITTNLGFFRGILEDEAFRRGELHTGFIGDYLKRRGPHADDAAERAVAALVAAAIGSRRPSSNGSGTTASVWKHQGRNSGMR